MDEFSKEGIGPALVESKISLSKEFPFGWRKEREKISFFLKKKKRRRRRRKKERKKERMKE